MALLIYWIGSALLIVVATIVVVAICVLIVRKIEDIKDSKKTNDSDKKRIRIFSKKIVVHANGRDLRLPSGSTVLDLVFHVDKELGIHCAGAYVNREKRTIIYILHDGDYVSNILTDDKQYPKTEWLYHVTTNKAKKSIESYLSKQNNNIEKQHKIQNDFEVNDTNNIVDVTNEVIPTKSQQKGVVDNVELDGTDKQNEHEDGTDDFVDITNEIKPIESLRKNIVRIDGKVDDEELNQVKQVVDNVNARNVYKYTRRWIGLDENVKVADITLKRGCFYLGGDSVSEDNLYSSAVIYPMLPIITDNFDKNQLSIDKLVISSYDKMHPIMRYEYLQFLSGDCELEKIQIELVALYVYGIRMKLFVDESNYKEQVGILNSLLQLYEELNKLCVEYDYKKFNLKRIIEDTISLIIIKYVKIDNYTFVIKDILSRSDEYMDYVIDNDLRCKSYSISAETAYDIAKKSFLFNKLPIDSYEKEIKSQFIKVFKNVKGHSLTFGKWEKKYECIPNCFYYDSYGGFSEYFQPKKVKSNFFLPSYYLYFQLEQIISKGIDSYWYAESVRLTNKNTHLTYLQLPEFIDIHKEKRFLDLKNVFYNGLMKGGDFSNLDIDAIIDVLGYEVKTEKLYFSIIKLVNNALCRLNLRIFPLIDFDNKRLNYHDNCVLYKINDDENVQRTSSYAMAEVVVKLMSMIIKNDRCDDEDAMFVKKYIESTDNSNSNKKHLLAYFYWLKFKKQIFDKKTKDFICEQFSDEQKECTIELLLKLSMHNGDISKNRMEQLMKVIPLLGESEVGVHSRIHRILSNDEQFATIESETSAKEYRIKKIETNKTRVGIDKQKLESIKKETLEAQTILSNIFVEEDNDENNSQDIKEDNPIMDILKSLLNKEQWQYSEVEELCKKYNVMMGFVLERINDYAFDMVGDSVVEDDGECINIITEYKGGLGL